MFRRRHKAAAAVAAAVLHFSDITYTNTRTFRPPQQVTLIGSPIRGAYMATTPR